MTTDDLIQRVYADLNENRFFWDESEIVINGLDPAQRLLCLLNPQLLVQRIALTLDPDDVLLDLRARAPRAWRVLRVILGDHTLTPPGSQGHAGDLRQTSLEALQGQREWFLKRKAFPEAWYPFGLAWVGLYPRQTQPLLVTLVFAALPLPLRVEEPTREPEIAPAYHPVIADVAIPLLLAKEGAGAEIEHATSRLEMVLGAEPLKKLQQQLLREQRYELYKKMHAGA